DARLRDLEGRKALVRTGDVLVAPAVVDRLSAGIRGALGAHHRTDPLSDGMPREEVRERLFARGHPAIFEAAVGGLMSAGVVAGTDRLALAEHRVALSPEESRARAVIEQAFRD